MRVLLLTWTRSSYPYSIIRLSIPISYLGEGKSWKTCRQFQQPFKVPHENVTSFSNYSTYVTCSLELQFVSKILQVMDNIGWSAIAVRSVAITCHDTECTVLQQYSMRHCYEYYFESYYCTSSFLAPYFVPFY